MVAARYNRADAAKTLGISVEELEARLARARARLAGKVQAPKIVAPPPRAPDPEPEPVAGPARRPPLDARPAVDLDDDPIVGVDVTISGAVARAREAVRAAEELRDKIREEVGDVQPSGNGVTIAEPDTRDEEDEDVEAVDVEREAEPTPEEDVVDAEIREVEDADLDGTPIAILERRPYFDIVKTTTAREITAIEAEIGQLLDQRTKAAEVLLAAGGDDRRSYAVGQLVGADGEARPGAVGVGHVKAGEEFGSARLPDGAVPTAAPVEPEPEERSEVPFDDPGGIVGGEPKPEPHDEPEPWQEMPAWHVDGPEDRRETMARRQLAIVEAARSRNAKGLHTFVVREIAEESGLSKMDVQNALGALVGADLLKPTHSKRRAEGVTAGPKGDEYALGYSAGGGDLDGATITEAAKAVAAMGQGRVLAIDLSVALGCSVSRAENLLEELTVDGSLRRDTQYEEPRYYYDG